jgi:glutathione S-transferase
VLHRGHGSRPTAIARCWNKGTIRSPALDGVSCKYGSSALGRLWRAERFADAACIGSVEQAATTQLAGDFAYIDEQIANRKWVTGADFSVADLHLFVFGRLGLRVTPSTRDFPNFYRHTLSIAGLAATMSAIAQEGITFEGPKSGPG